MTRVAQLYLTVFFGIYRKLKEFLFFHRFLRQERVTNVYGVGFAVSHVGNTKVTWI